MFCFSRLDNIAVLAALQAIQASSQQQRSYIGAELPIPPPPLNSAPRFNELEDKKASTNSASYFTRGQIAANIGSILHQPQHVRTSSGGILMKRSAAMGPSVNFQEKQQSDYSSILNQAGAGEMFPVRDIPSSSGSSIYPVPPPPPMATSLASLTSMPSILPPPGKLPTIYPPPPPSSSSTSGGGDQPSMGTEFPLAEPPFEYSSQAVTVSKQETSIFSRNKHKNSSDGAPDVKRGLLSSILEKVRSKDSESPSVGGTTSSSSKDSNKLNQGANLTSMTFNQGRSHVSGLAPLASSESLATTTASIGSIGSTSSVIHKPFEPPGLGKPSRVTPVGLDEADDDLLSAGDRLSATESMSVNQDTSSVEVLSVIRFNKSVSSTMGGGGSSIGGKIERATSKISSTSNLSSEKAFSSSSETAPTSNHSTNLRSFIRQRSAEDVLRDNAALVSPCPACDASTISHSHKGRSTTATYNNANSRRRARSEGRRSRESRNSHKIRSNDPYGSEHRFKSDGSEKLYDTEDEADISTSVPAYNTVHRRLSAPEIDENSLCTLSTTGGTYGTGDVTSSEDVASSIISSRIANILPRVPMPNVSNNKRFSGRPIAIQPYDSSYYTNLSKHQFQRHRKHQSSPGHSHQQQVAEKSKQRYPSYSGKNNTKRSNAPESGGQEEYHTSSDSEVGSGSRPGSRATRSRSPRYSLGSIDSQDLQKAVAHIQETLKMRMEKREGNSERRENRGEHLQSNQNKSEVIAVVHRSSESPPKEHRKTHRDDRTSSPAESTSSRKSATMEELGPYDTIKPSRMRKGPTGNKNDNGNGFSKRNNNNNITTNRNIVRGKQDTKSNESSDKVVIRVQPPAVPPKPETLKQPTTGESSTTPRKSNLERADSFEGHEEAVRTLVEAVNESRKFEASISAKQSPFSGRTESPSDKSASQGQSNPS